MDIGARVEKRGLGHEGEVIARRGKWVSVRWDDGRKARDRPAICHEGELIVKPRRVPTDAEIAQAEAIRDRMGFAGPI